MMVDMVATGARASALVRLLSECGWEQVAPPPLPRFADLSTGVQALIRHTYDLLGGAPEQFDRIRPGGYDLAFTTPDGMLLVELDEEQHFNRYRALTLPAAGRLGLPWVPAYLDYCARHEARLLPGWGTGRRWTNPSAARFFGEPSPPGDFTGNGAPRWRQRAFYDSVKDALPRRTLSRVSVYDTVVDGLTLESQLRRPEAADVEAVRALVSGRAHRS